MESDERDRIREKDELEELRVKVSDPLSLLVQ